MPPLRVLFLASEVAPFAKTGGLADVTGSLPKALAELGHEIRVVMPAHGSIEAAVRGGKGGIRPSEFTLRVPTGDGLVEAGVFESVLPGTDIPIWFVAERNLFDRPSLYGDWDDAYRYAFFSRAALDLAIAAQAWRPDVVHAHDWHTAAALFWLAVAGQADERYRAIPTLYTIHNLMHQGHAPWDLQRYLALSAPAMHEERYGQINFMARGILHGTLVNTVSPTYAREIMTVDGGFGLDGLLRFRHYDVHGVLNGIDHDVWNPATDLHLARRYDLTTLDDRAHNKRALQQRLGLAVRDVPVVAAVTRLDGQKGVGLMGHVVHLLMNGQAGEAQFVVLGSGAPEYEGMFKHLADYHRDKMAAVLRYDAELAPLVYAGSDVFLMPSLFEPCGLGQLIAMRYGSVPVVRATGGLADTVRDGVSGFCFDDYSSDALWNTLARALYIHNVDKDSWRAIQRHGMSSDFSWRTSARGYQQLYEWAIARVRGW